MAADYAALEARVAELEQQLRHIVPAKIDAVAYGLSLVHADTQTMRDQLDHQAERQRQQGQRLDTIDQRLDTMAGQLAGQGQQLAGQGQRLDAIDRRLDAHGQMLTDHGHLLAEILRRLPASE